MDRFSSGLGLVAEALNTGNAISEKLHDVVERQVSIAERQAPAIEKRNDIIQRTRPHIYFETGVWDMLTEINVMEQYRMQCYEFLCINEQNKRLLFGVPPNMRLQALIQMMGVATEWQLIYFGLYFGAQIQKIKEWESKESGSKDHNKVIIKEQKEQYGRKVYTIIVKECNDNQVESYLEGLLARYLVEPRLMNLDFFHSNGFEFQDLIEYQGLKHFMSIECNYLVELVKVLYCNTTIANEDLLSEVKMSKFVLD
ncbi:hypothetical protein SESBI_33313 [Sesbania bispinosa]|nr:hypothetical protein SESBI_33313 [Sesbania bispinosa]